MIGEAHILTLRGGRCVRSWSSAFIFVCAALMWVTCAHAQDTGTTQLRIIVAPQITVQDASSFPISIAIEPQSAAPAGSRVRVLSTEIPVKELEFSSGRIDSVSWSIPAADLPSLQLRVAKRATGSTWLIIGLFDSTGAILTSASSKLIIEAGPSSSVETTAVAPAEVKPAERIAETPAAQPSPAPVITPVEVNPVDKIAEAPTPAPVVAPAEKIAEAPSTEAQPAPPPVVAPAEVKPADRAAEAPPPKPEPAPQIALDSAPPAAAPARPPQSATLAPLLSPADRAIAERFLDLGERQISLGNVAIARQYFLRAADMGLAGAAFRLAETYDPAEITRIKAQGLRPNPAEAKRWYDRAAVLGARDTESRIQRLGAR